MSLILILHGDAVVNKDTVTVATAAHRLFLSPSVYTAFCSRNWCYLNPLLMLPALRHDPHNSLSAVSVPDLHPELGRLRMRQYVRRRCYLNDGTSLPQPLNTQATLMDVKPMSKTRKQLGENTFAIYKVMGRRTSNSGCRSGTDHGTKTCARHTNCQRVMLRYIARLRHLLRHQNTNEKQKKPQINIYIMDQIKLLNCIHFYAIVYFGPR